MTDLHATDKAAQALTSEEGGFPAQTQAPPGLTTEMDPHPDHGEDTWIGRDRLPGLKASSPAATRASAAPSPSRSLAKAPTSR